MCAAEVKRDVLPTYVKPVHYDLDVSNINVNNNSFDGKVKIELDVQEDTNEIKLNVNDLQINTVELEYSITKTESIVQITETSLDAKSQTATFKLGETLKAGPGSKAFLTISYSGPLRDDMNSFYKSSYTDKNGKENLILSTQFEATEARGAFPCFDEPNLKATFTFSITVAEDYTALSNTPVLSSKVLDDGKKKGAVEASGLKLVKFQKTPIMPTYLLAWVIGKLEYVEAFTDRSYSGKKIPVRVYTAEGESAKGNFALQVATKVVDYFSEVFDIDYYLPKLDMVAIPAFSSNAMENTALITFRETALLFDENSSDSKYKEKVAYVVSHELAHQWFGNLVTMDWWDELWLNEGFATWVGTLAVDKLYPEWETFATFTTVSLQTALDLDALRGSHPVEVPIKSASDIDQVFDAISYLKGASIIRQLAATLGVDKLLKGVSNYLKEHQYGNATTKDLWRAIGEASGVDVVSIADPWIRKIGFPYVEVEVDSEKKSVKVSQNRFLSTGDVKEEENQTNWWIPLNAYNGESVTKDLSISQKSETLDNVSVEPFFKLNKDTVGFFRTKYDDATLSNIISNLDKLSNTDKVGIISDTSVLSIAGIYSTSKALDVISAFKGETDYAVWLQLLASLKKISSTWFEQPEEVQAGLKILKQEIVEPAVLSLGFEAAANESFLTTQLRIELLSAAVSAGIPQVIDELKKLFAKLKNGEDIDPSLRKIVISSVISAPDATEEDFDFVYGLIATSDSTDASEVILNALGTVTNPVLIQKALGLILNPEIPIMNISFVSIPLTDNTKARAAFWTYLKDNFEAIVERLKVNRMVYDRFFKFTLGKFASEEVYDDIKGFFADKETHDYQRSIDQVLDGIKSNASWVSRDKDVVSEWLKAHNYI